MSGRNKEKSQHVAIPYLKHNYDYPLLGRFSCIFRATPSVRPICNLALHAAQSVSFDIKQLRQKNPQKILNK
jgi:hypothetical protein